MNAASGNSSFGNSIRAAERLRISRELHDSTSQLLVALQLQLGQLRTFPGLGSAELLLDDIGDTLRSIHESIKRIETYTKDNDVLENRQVQTAKVFLSLAKTPR